MDNAEIKTCPVCRNAVNEKDETCPACGYRLVESTQKFVPISISEMPSSTSATKGATAELRVVRGPQTGIALELTEGTMTLGRDPSCDIFLNDMTVSRKHASIETNEKGCIIRDTNSYNGVWVNDKMIESCLLVSGDVIQIGAFCPVFREK